MEEFIKKGKNRFDILTEIIKTRRAVYPAMYINKEIDDSTLMGVLENANWAPSHRKTEPWRFKIFKGDGLKILANHLGEFYKNNTPKENFSPKKYEKTLNKPLKCGAVIAICMQRDPEERVPEWEEEAAVACAVQNMWLTCSSLGIGCYWSTPNAIYHSDEFLNLRKGEKCLGLFYMGYIKDFEIIAERGRIEQKVEWRR